MNKTKIVGIRLSDREYDIIRQKMELCNMQSISSYFRKMALEGMVINLDVPELKEILRLLRISSNNINQLAKRMNAGNNVYETDISEIKNIQTEALGMMRKIYTNLLKI